MTQFPAQLDTFQNPSASTPMDAAGLEHDQQHANLNDAVRALQVKVGINGSGNTDSLDFKVSQLLKLLDARYVFDSGAQQYRPLTCVNGQLGVGDVVADDGGVDADAVAKIWDSGAGAFRSLTCVNGVLGVGDVIT